jgi:hypothetical protein
MQTRAVWGVLASLVLVLTMALPGIVAASTPVAAFVTANGGTSAGVHILAAESKTVNWAGHVATGSTGTVTKASANWIVPAVTCTSSYSLALFWVGIDGYNTGSVEQTGTWGQCSGGTASYGAWWELYPLNAIQTWNGMTISPGDHMTGTVAYSTSSHKFSMTITDHATGQQFEVIGTQSGTTESTAECIVEAAYGSGNSDPYYLLADFGKAHFTSCTATIAGTSAGIGSFGTATEIKMVDYATGTHNLATPGPLSGDKTFVVTWHAGS